MESAKPATHSSRVIKFRGWDTKRNEWIPTRFAISNLGEAVFYFTGRITLSQWTGLRDKNGREIYEGDILSSRSSKGYLVTVKWLTAYARFAFVNDVGDVSPLLMHNDWHIIGNVYKDPDLLTAA